MISLVALLKLLKFFFISFLLLLFLFFILTCLLCRLYGSGETVSSESDRVQEAGGWIDDGRVCDILAVSRAFGDREFKGEGLPVMLRKGVE